MLRDGFTFLLKKIIQYGVLTMHVLKIPLGFFKNSLNVQCFLRFSYETSLNEEKVGCYATWE